MKKNFRVITINGIRGLLAVIFIAFGLVAGFIISPSWLCMTIWNHFAINTAISTITLLQGFMLWTLVALSLYALNGNKPLISFGAFPALSPEQMRDIMQKANSEESLIIRNIEKRIQEINKELPQSLPIQNIEKQETKPMEEEKEEIRS